MSKAKYEDNFPALGAKAAEPKPKIRFANFSSIHHHQGLKALLIIIH
jgi:hypothetical protein